MSLLFHCLILCVRVCVCACVCMCVCVCVCVCVCEYLEERGALICRHSSHDGERFELDFLVLYFMHLLKALKASLVL